MARGLTCLTASAAAASRANSAQRVTPWLAAGRARLGRRRLRSLDPGRSDSDPALTICHRAGCDDWYRRTRKALATVKDVSWFPSAR